MADDAARDHLALKVAPTVNAMVKRAFRIDLGAGRCGVGMESGSSACWHGSLALGIGGMLILAGRQSKASASLDLANIRGMLMTPVQTVSRCRMSGGSVVRGILASHQRGGKRQDLTTNPEP